MRSRPLKQSTVLFVGFLLLAGCANLLSRTQNYLFSSLMFTANFIICFGLLLFWIQSVRQRLLPSRTKGYILAAACLMLVLLLQRIFKYRIFSSHVITRYLVYTYYIPLMLIPALFLMACIRIRAGEGLFPESGEGWRPAKELFVLLPAVLLAFAVLTNDLHHLVYLPQIEMASFIVGTGTYTYGPVFYLLYAFMILTVLCGLILLFKASGKTVLRDNPALPLVLLLWSAMLLLCTMVFDRNIQIRPYSMPEIQIFGLLGIFEACIRGRLIPYNENYVGFFQNMPMSALITDTSFSPVFHTLDIPPGNVKDRKRSLREAVYPIEDIRLDGKAIRAGYVFWATDERELHRMYDRLLDAGEMLEAENTLIEAENRQKEEQAHMEFQTRIYRQIETQLRPTQEKIADILSKMQPGDETFRRDLQRICIYNAYVKRATNLMLLAAEKEMAASRELCLALQESARYLTCYGIKAEVVDRLGQPIASGHVFSIYRTFEELVEFFLESITYLTCTITKEAVRLVVDGAELSLTLPETTLPVRAFQDDGLLYLTISAGYDGSLSDSQSGSGLQGSSDLQGASDPQGGSDPQGASDPQNGGAA